MSAGTHQPAEIEVFYDGACPVCSREVAWLARRDRKRRWIRFIDIAAPEFDAAMHGVELTALMARIHARFPDGRWITGVEVFRQLYRRIGFGPLVLLTRIPGISHALDAAYARFAANRLRLTGRCDDQACRVWPRESRQ